MCLPFNNVYLQRHWPLPFVAREPFDLIGEPPRRLAFAEVEKFAVPIVGKGEQEFEPACMTAMGAGRRAKTVAAVSLPSTVTSSVQASRRDVSSTPAAVQIARALSC